MGTPVPSVSAASTGGAPAPPFKVPAAVPAHAAPGSGLPSEFAGPCNSSLDRLNTRAVERGSCEHLRPLKAAADEARIVHKCVLNFFVAVLFSEGAPIVRPAYSDTPFADLNTDNCVGADLKLAVRHFHLNKAICSSATR